MDTISHHITFDSPLGFIKIAASETGISGLSFVDEMSPDFNGNSLLVLCRRQLLEYFSHSRTEFDLPLDLHGTEFQKRTWEELRRIPCGKTISYLELAKKLGNALLIRAAGGANSRNPLAIIVPCHRVIGSDGSLTGFSGGLDRKKWLLEFEAKYVQSELFS